MKESFQAGLMDDVFILKLIQKGDKQAFKYLFDSFFAALCRFLRIYVGDHSVAEEIALDVFTAVWEKRESLEIKISWKAYLFRAARNRAFNYIRDNDRFVFVSDWSLHDKTEIDHSLELKELEHLIQEAVYTLPDLCRDIFRRSRMDHQTNKEIAGELNISVKYVEAQITKALKLIKKYLGDSYHYLW
ncbi:RNA polymerase sigma-70 factor (family 1) [Parabacteroides sp. PFB2-12]|uniref:RNA polymerase sigma-70 factor n=1 Tax=unclassified Parabacteroides TaxID=2649774 RepID=UPI0024758BFB|nr:MULTISPECIES: RNA polymerase sigma-70 factor [unclassified Parabacteroides]MDH6342590.1 RNA polymerase sigma-70 factor (family 1) [Parabacteroides sp. PM6-13]MDH6390242.1 RNA polymerase sigma-70 factor (family 1) [Parabacteroides sp. PFB2-12]